ncbi:MAG: ArsR family transcriptional regulator [Desulfuromonas sp.]|nr:MAG: ArsR family transcriptional regulator [Desulfuromonas sp.]
MNEQLVDQFVETWGAMGSSWGVNSSVARVHGLLIVTDRAWCIDDIVERLQISKSNVSTSLKELRSWNVVRKVFQPGERKEYYVCEPNAWEMLFNIMRQRKQREFDPLLANVAQTFTQAQEDGDGIAVDRLGQMKSMLDTFNKLANMALASESQVKGMIRFIAGK